jgi:hypothetical protein
VRTGVRISVGVKFSQGQEKEANTGEGTEAHDKRDKRMCRNSCLCQQFLSAVYKNDMHEYTMTNSLGIIEFEVMGPKTDVRPSLRETVH